MRRLSTILCLVIAVLGFAVAATAAPLSCATDAPGNAIGFPGLWKLSGLSGEGFSCLDGDKIYSNFTWTPSPLPGSTPTNQVNVNITSDSNGGNGDDHFIGFTPLSGFWLTQTYILGFDVEVVNPNAYMYITRAVAQIQAGQTSNSNLTTATATFSSLTPNNGAFWDVALNATSTDNETGQVIFDTGQVKKMHVQFTLNGTPSGPIHSFNINFYEAIETPEPITFGLTGVALAGLALWRRGRRS